MSVQIIIAIAIGYLLGSIPSAYIIARLKLGIDIRERGGGNVGTMQVWREVGPPYAIITLLGDMAKGALAVYIARWLGLELIWTGAAGFAAVVGHNWPAFLGFRGGKGAATIMGVLLAFMPAQFAIGLAVAALILIFTGNVRLGMIGLALIPLIAWLFDKEAIYIYYPIFLILFLIAYLLTGLRADVARAKKEGRKWRLVERDFNFLRGKKDKEVK
ncbi:MAG: hypothetical protein A2Z15_02290 [Chloroflexi bacterium RBG_16_50_11]|nr:MAG: hypothetical protein A2Z15_02290 [Chloroflexi bacterium RBG_16_50_11]